MPVEPSALSAADVERLADRLGLDVPEVRAEELAGTVTDDLRGYGAVDPLPEPDRFGGSVVENPRFDPGPDEDPLNAFITRFSARTTDDGPLAGLDVAVKDNMAVAGVPMTCGTHVFESAIPGGNGAVVQRLLDGGARLVGKTNMDELAYGPTSETSQFGPVANPADPNHVAGGSSSGSGSAVGAGTVDAALGSDTGGSVRIPASFCGVVGFKPSWGVVPRTGFVDLAYSLDHIGPLARDVGTTALVFDAIAGEDPRDPASALARHLQGGAVDALPESPAVADLSLGVPVELLGDHLSAGVRDHVDDLLAGLEAEGASLTEVSIPSIRDSVAPWNALTNVELATSFLASGIPLGRRLSFDTAWQDAAAAALAANGAAFGDVVLSKVLQGATLLDRYHGRHYVRARNWCSRIESEFEDALDGHDALVSPTMPVVAPKIGTWGGYDSGEDAVPLAYNTRPADLVGVPAISVPGGTVDGLPVGVQFMGRRYDDATVLQVARTFERWLGEEA